jgi:hypothetical protein
MSKARSATDQITTTQLKNNITTAKEVFYEHRMVCPHCRAGKDFPQRACDRGWNLTKAVRRAENDLSVYLGTTSGNTASGQEPLW